MAPGGYGRVAGEAGGGLFAALVRLGLAGVSGFDLSLPGVLDFLGTSFGFRWRRWGSGVAADERASEGGDGDSEDEVFLPGLHFGAWSLFSGLYALRSFTAGGLLQSGFLYSWLYWNR